VNVLLDTHVAVWWSDDPSLVSAEARGVLSNPLNSVWFSSASAWELAIKIRSGKLDLDVTRLVSGLTSRGIRLLGIGVDDAITAGSLDWGHRDPFDRMLVAQARRLDLSLLSRDSAIRLFLPKMSILA
jgi:PIN domain nuclease of toxin-antitoxin system